MKVKKFLLLVSTLLFIVGGAVSVFANETTTQTEEETPGETMIISGDTYILDTNINGHNVNLDDRIVINNHTYYKTANNFEIIVSESLPCVVIVLVILLVIISVKAIKMHYS